MTDLPIQCNRVAVPVESENIVACVDCGRYAKWRRNMSESTDWKLVVVEGPDLGRQFALGRGSVTLGRGHRDELNVSDPCVTRQQLAFKWNCTTNSHVVYQTGDSFTAFNSIPASRNAGVCHQLREGDQLQIGRTVLRYTLEAPDLISRSTPS